MLRHSTSPASTLELRPTSSPAKGRGSDLTPMLTLLRGEFDDAMDRAVSELGQRIGDSASLAPARRALRTFLSRRGKAVRPLLFLGSYCLFHSQRAWPNQAVMDIACALELFHGFALVHDDVIDESPSRRGAPSLHKRLELEAGLSPEGSEKLAVVLGDILFPYAIECFSRAVGKTPHALEALQAFLRVGQETGVGQAIEIAHMETDIAAVSEDEIRRTYFLKTTRYTIETPLVLGALLAGAGEHECNGLRAFAEPLGLAFQIQNDLHEIELCEGGEDALAYDLQRGVKTLFLKQLHQALPEEEQRVLERLLRSRRGQDAAERLRGLIQREPVKPVLEKEVARLFKDAQQRLAESAISQTQQAHLRALAGFIGKHSHHSEAAR